LYLFHLGQYRAPRTLYRIRQRHRRRNRPEDERDRRVGTERGNRGRQQGDSLVPEKSVYQAMKQMFKCNTAVLRI